MLSFLWHPAWGASMVAARQPPRSCLWQLRRSTPQPIWRASRPCTESPRRQAKLAGRQRWTRVAWLCWQRYTHASHGSTVRYHCVLQAHEYIAWYLHVMARTIIGLLTGTWGMGSGVSERAMGRRILMFTSVGTAGALAGKAWVLAGSSRQLRTVATRGAQTGQEGCLHREKTGEECGGDFCSLACTSLGFGCSPAEADCCCCAVRCRRCRQPHPVHPLERQRQWLGEVCSS